MLGFYDEHRAYIMRGCTIMDLYNINVIKHGRLFPPLNDIHPVMDAPPL